MKRGFTVIEILIAMMILFVAIGFVNISIQTFNNYKRKSETYQRFYITVLSLKDWIVTQKLDKKSYNGELNKIEYKINVEKMIQMKNYKFNFEIPSGNYGDFMITLYRVTMILKERRRVKEYTFFVTKDKRTTPLKAQVF
jgi:prepilin-type N-terminal cleavage/methylation domain-containing protein